MADHADATREQIPGLRVPKTFTGGASGSRISAYRSIMRYNRRVNRRLGAEAARRVRRAQQLASESTSPHVLDLGCGGRAGTVLGLQSVGIKTVGIDYDVTSPRASFGNWVEIARRNGVERAAKTIGRQLAFDRGFYRALEQELGIPLRWDGLDLRTMDACDLRFEDETFSLVISTAVFEHIADVPTAVREVHRVLRAGGRAQVRAHLFPSVSGGHALDWADYDDVTTPRTEVPPWDHLRQRQFPTHVYLNELRADEYLAHFARWFEIEQCSYVTEGESLLTPEIRAELSDWSREDLTRRSIDVVLRKRSSSTDVS